MELVAFLSALQSRTLPAIPRAVGNSPVSEPNDRNLADALRNLDQAVRLDRPEDLPELDLAAAAWATEQLHALWSSLGEASDVAASRETHCPSDTSQSATHFSVDLVMRHLPFLAARADSLAANDARRQVVRRLAASWPLSSVGIDGVDAIDATPLLAHDGLRRTYAERILRRRDASRQQDDNVQLAVDAVIKEHRAFATEVLAVHDELIKQRPQ
tara:strand:- start:40153 stop:40797 length:645 start_codon:yes stop_codon:yes gene_type:complete